MTWNGTDYYATLFVASQLNHTQSAPNARESHGFPRFERVPAPCHAALALLCALSLTASLAADPPAPPLVLTADLNSDGVAEIITAEENQLTVTNGLTGTQLVRFQGEAPGDGFGSVALVIPDANGDGDPELLVAAPDAGAVYLFQSPWLSPCSDLVSAARADAVVRVPDAHASVTEFGGTLRAMFDVDGDDLGEVQISARTINAQGQPSVRIYIFSPSRSEVLVQFDPIVATADAPEVPGDVDGNAEVTNTDPAVILQNFTLPVPTRQSGDLDGDGVVGLTDLTEVITEFGRRGYEGITPPPNAAGAVLCDLGSAGVAWVTPRASAMMKMLIVETPGSEALAIETTLVPSYFPPGFFVSSCGQLLDGCDEDPRLQLALRMLSPACDVGLSVKISCLPGGNPHALGKVHFYCSSSSPRHAAILLNTSSPDLCGTLAHELVHVAQACAAGFFDGSIPCATFNRQGWFLLWSLCSEFEAHQFAGLCEAGSGTDLIGCCERICAAYDTMWSWRAEGCANPCEACCINYALGCCERGEWACSDQLCPGGPFIPQEPRP